MRPGPPQVMQAAVKVLEEVSLGMTDEQEITRLRGVITLLSILQGEWDTCASARVAAISRYTDIVRGGSLLTEGDRRERLNLALARVDGASSDLRISSLEATLDQLRTTIIELQRWLEDSDGPEHAALRTEIWRAQYEDARNEDRNTPLW
jgi:hypothetical protein